MAAISWKTEDMQALRKYAEDNPTSINDVLNGINPPAGDIEGHVLQLGGGVKLVYSIETDQPLGVCRHMSVSLDNGKWPPPVTVVALGRELGFRPSLRDGRFWLDKETDSVNWVQVKDVT